MTSSLFRFSYFPLNKYPISAQSRPHVSLYLSCVIATFTLCIRYIAPHVASAYVELDSFEAERKTHLAHGVICLRHFLLSDNRVNTQSTYPGLGSRKGVRREISSARLLKRSISSLMTLQIANYIPTRTLCGRDELQSCNFSSRASLSSPKAP